MNIKRNFLAWTVQLLLITTSHNPSSMLVSGFIAARTAFILSGSAVVLALCYVGYGYGKKYVEQKVIDEIVNDFVIACTTRATIEKLSPEKQEEILRKKAKLVTMRKRIINSLDEQIKADTSLSTAHHDALASNIKLAQTAFEAIDFLRTENPFEKEYEEASMIDAVVENRIRAALIAAAKPADECTPQEIAASKAKEEMQAQLLERLQDKIPSLALNTLKQSPMLLSSLLEK
jgi:hypothetical protein